MLLAIVAAIISISFLTLIVLVFVRSGKEGIDRINWELTREEKSILEFYKGVLNRYGINSVEERVCRKKFGKDDKMRALLNAIRVLKEIEQGKT